jgi:hypothetical protein
MRLLFYFPSAGKVLICHTMGGMFQYRECVGLFAILGDGSRRNCLKFGLLEVNSVAGGMEMPKLSDALFIKDMSR